jgi:hypothetical protein
MKRVQFILSHFNFPITPVLLAISFVSSMFLQNITQLYVNSLYLPLVGIILISIILTLLFSTIYKDVHKAELFLSVAIPMFFQYSTVLSKVGTFYLQIGSFAIARNSVVFPLFLVLYLSWFLIVRKLGSPSENLIQYLRIVALLSALYPLCRIAAYSFKERLFPPIQSGTTLPKPDRTISLTDLPDIYYIVPEDYAGPQVLKQSFHFDDTPFLNALQEKGFYIATQSASNYPKTFLSLGSSLNLEYLDAYKYRVSSSDETALDPIITNNTVMKYLKAYGYSYIHMGSWWQSTQYNEDADENYTLFPQTKSDTYNFLTILIDASLLHPFAQNVLREYAPYSSDGQKREAILYQFDELPKVAKLAGPKFVFLHLIAPHGPYVFDKNCNPIGLEQTRGRYEEDNYVDQVNCINTKLLELITSIQRSSIKKPVIILQTDEGAPFLNGWLTPIDSWNSATDDLLKKKFPILSAFYFPDAKKSLLYPTISPVNTFRVLFNTYFQTNLEILPDKNFIFPDLSHLYEFRDVTDRVR